MNLALDTSAYIDLCKGDKNFLQIVRLARRIFMPFTVLGELRAGFRCGTRSDTNERNLNKFLASERVELLFANDDTTHHYATLFYQLRKSGKPIPTNDLWIAALAIQHNVFLASSDKHFDAIPQLLRAA